MQRAWRLRKGHQILTSCPEVRPGNARRAAESRWVCYPVVTSGWPAPAGAPGGRDGRLLTVAEVAEELATCTATVYKLVASGALPCVCVLNSIRVRRDELEGFERGGPARSS